MCDGDPTQRPFLSNDSETQLSNQRFPGVLRNDKTYFNSAISVENQVLNSTFVCLLGDKMDEKDIDAPSHHGSRGSGFGSRSCCAMDAEVFPPVEPSASPDLARTHFSVDYDNPVLIFILSGAPACAAQQRRLPSVARQSEGGLLKGSRSFGWQADHRDCRRPVRSVSPKRRWRGCAFSDFVGPTVAVIIRP